MKIPLLIVGIALATSCPSWGRVFNIQNETFAPYIVFGATGSSVGANPFQGETSQNLYYSAGSKNQYSGEFGFIYTTSLLNFRVGLEILKPMSAHVTASNLVGELYSVKSDFLGLIPKVGLEANLQGNKTSRSFASVTYGASIVSFKNEYSLTDLGKTTFSGVDSHSVETKGSGSEIAAALGYEGHLSDRTTLTVEFGYKMMKINNWTYAADTNTFSGVQSSGDSWSKVNGVKRELDFSGGFILLGFRFYL